MIRRQQVTDQLAIKHRDLGELIEEVFRNGEYFNLRAYGTSMSPFVRAGDLLTITRHSQEMLRPGDIVLYRVSAGQLAVHRIVGINRFGRANGQERMRVRGDRLMAPLEFVYPGQVLGKVEALRRRGCRIELTAPGRRIGVFFWICVFRPILRAFAMARLLPSTGLVGRFLVPSEHPRANVEMECGS